MQSEAMGAVDFGSESDATRSLYGLDEDVTRPFGEKCLLARRLVERGVRFVQVYCNDEWDAHTDLADNHGKPCRETDRPIAGLLTDLKQRGLLDSTLVIWGGEFGRMPDLREGQRPRPQPARLSRVDGRRRHQGRHEPGATDEIGWKAAELPVAEIFADGMVFSAGCVPVWGRGSAGTVVTVEFAGLKRSAIVAGDGKWSRTFPPWKPLRPDPNRNQRRRQRSCSQRCAGMETRSGMDTRTQLVVNEGETGWKRGRVV